MAQPPINPKVLSALKAVAAAKRKPIVVTNPNDPRLKAYQDSLGLYNANPKFNVDNFLEESQGVYSKREKNNLPDIYKRDKILPESVLFPDLKIADKTDSYMSIPVYMRDKNGARLLDKNGKPIIHPTALGSAAFYKKPEQPVVLQRNNGTTRPDGTQKGKGFFGEIKRPDGKISTELSISTSDIIPGKEALIPTMVPTLTHPEVQHLLSGKYNPQARQGVDDIISRKAIDFARQRAAKKQPFFATPQEEGKFRPQAVPIPALLTPKQGPIPQAPLPATPAPQPVSVAQPIQPAPPNKPDSLWAPGQRYSLKDEKVRQMLKAIQSLKK